MKQASEEKSFLARENVWLKKKLEALEPQIVLHEPSAPELNGDVECLQQELISQRDETLRAEREKKQLEIQLFSTRNENSILKKEFAQFSSVFAPVTDNLQTCRKSGNCPVTGDCPGEDCPRRRLCVRRIFMIGGITKMKSYYRQIVEKAGGEFDYHDGYLKNSNEDLAAKVRRCDVVVCPVSCNSHNACLKVKNLCTRYNKELKILAWFKNALLRVTQKTAIGPHF